MPLPSVGWVVCRLPEWRPSAVDLMWSKRSARFEQTSTSPVQERHQICGGRTLVRPLRSRRHSGHQRATPREQMDNEQDDRDDEKHPSDLGCDSGHAGYTQRACDEPENEKNQRVVQHGSLPGCAMMAQRPSSGVAGTVPTGTRSIVDARKAVALLY